MILKKLFIIILRSLRPLRRCSGHAWRSFDSAQDMLCARYSEFRLWLCRARTFAVVIHRINYQQSETLQ